MSAPDTIADWEKETAELEARARRFIDRLGFDPDTAWKLAKKHDVYGDPRPANNRRPS